MTRLVLLALVVIAARFTVPMLWRRYTNWRWRRFRRTLAVAPTWEYSDRESA